MWNLQVKRETKQSKNWFVGNNIIAWWHDVVGKALEYNGCAV